MNDLRLYMHQWLKANGRQRMEPTDSWYLDFAKHLLPIILQSPLFASRHADRAAETALKASLYFQDAIAQSGGWKAFANKFRTRYAKPLPFYECTGYIDDEINLQDVGFLLWNSLSRPASHNTPLHVHNPHDNELLTLAGQIYDRMDQLFEEAPVAESASAPAWVMDIERLDIPSTPLPATSDTARLSRDVQRCLEYSNGYPLLYFPTYGELQVFLTQVLGWEDHPDSLLADLKGEKDFVIYANAKGMLMAPNVASCLCDPRNAAYNSQTASQTSYLLFCQPGQCPFDLLKYGMAHALLPDAALPFPGGKEILQSNWDFIARYFLGHYYEGD